MIPQSDSRFELKYLVPASVKVALMHDVAGITRPDRFALGPSRSYLVRSLYLESNHYAAYLEKISGIQQRLKLRIRTYSEDPTVKFLEIKQRFSNRILKRKHRLDPDQYQAVIEHRTIPGLDSSPVVREFWSNMARRRLQPMLTIEYRRQPFVAVGNSRLRVTFDTDCRVCRARSLEQHAALYRLLSPGYAIFEIKFDGHMPHWVHKFVRKYSLQDIACSKFCLGLEELARRGVLHYA